MRPLTDSELERVHATLPRLRKVAQLLHRRLPRCVELDDLIQWGALGLLDAAVRFDESRGLQFWTFAQPRIRFAMLDGLRSVDWVPRDVRRAGSIATKMVSLSGSDGQMAEQAEARNDAMARIESADGMAWLAGIVGVDRANLLLRNIGDGVTGREIAAEEGISFQAVHQRIGTALRRVREVTAGRRVDRKAGVCGSI